MRTDYLPCRRDAPLDRLDGSSSLFLDERAERVDRLGLHPSLLLDVLLDGPASLARGLFRRWR